MIKDWGKTWTRNEQNKNSLGGTERMVDGMLSRLNPEYLDKIQIIPSRVRDLHEDRIRILWQHDLWSDTESQHLRDENNRNRFHKIVFCGNWQATTYHMLLGFPQNHHSCVIDTAIVPFPAIEKGDPKEEIRMIYTSTPQRGLEILVPVFEELCKHHDNLVLDVFSSYKIYGWEGADKQFEEVFERCRNHPKINYHGVASNDVVREHVAKAHIFAYPSIWMECNSQSLIEAMSAGCMCVHPNFGGLTDTSASLTVQYQWDQDKSRHAGMFMNVLNDVILQLRSGIDPKAYQALIKTYADYRFGWDRVSAQWNALIGSLIAEYEGKSLEIPSKKFIYRTS